MSRHSNAPPPKKGAAPVSRAPASSSHRGARLQRKCACAGNASCQPCAQRKRLQRAARFGAEQGPTTVPPSVDAVLASPGQPLDASTRAFMEPRFQHDFGQVRVHTDARAAESARAVQALAYTVGNDIVFDQGQYQPGTAAGPRRLAHQLAHTVQQAGQTGAPSQLQAFDSPGETALEREAESVASAVMAMSQPEAAPAPGIRLHPGQATLSRVRRWIPIPERLIFTTDEGRHQVTHQQDLTASLDGATEGSTPEAEVSREAPEEASEERAASRVLPQGLRPRVAAFQVNIFRLPDSKGAVLPFYQAKVAAGALEATLSFAGGQPRAELKQHRDSTEALRSSWLRKMGWSSGQADALWQQAGGGSVFPNLIRDQGHGLQCQMDHIVELQVGGANIEENIIPLDERLNGNSGGRIWLELQSLAGQIRDDPRLFPDPQARPEEITLSFASVVQQGNPRPPAVNLGASANSCHQIEANALEMQRQSGTARQAPAGTVFYEVHAAGTSTRFKVPAETPSATNLADSDRDRTNRTARQLVPGLMLTVLNRIEPGTGNDSVQAQVDNRRDARIPITLRPPQAPGAIQFNILQRNERRELQLATRLPTLLFTYPYLSEGFLDLSYTPATGLTGQGKLTPSLRLLHQVPLDVFADFEKEEFRGAVRFPPERLTPPFPGLRFTRSELGLELSPRFRPYGTLGFEVGPRGKPVLEGSMTAEADESGFVARGELQAHLPGLEQARGTVEYRERRWSGGLTVEAQQIRLPFATVTGGSLEVRFTDEGLIEPSGSVSVELPGGQQVQLAVHQTKEGRWVFQGAGTLQVPGLQPVEVTFSHDGERLSASGSAAVDVRGLSGQLSVAYDPQGRLSAEGRLRATRKGLEGSLLARLSPEGKLSGEGSFRYPFTKDLVGTLGVVLGEDRGVRVKGAVEFQKPLSLFKAFGGQYFLFQRSLDIPLFAVPLGPVSVGLIARLTGALSASYGIGPGALHELKLAAAFDPFAQELNPELQFSGKLRVPAHAGVALSLRGAVGASAGIASVTGGLAATGIAALEGGLDATVNLRYTKQGFSLESEAALLAGLRLALVLNADVLAEADVGFKKFLERWSWRLAGYAWDSGLRLGLVAPLRYDSARGFTLPSPGNIRWIVPALDLGRLVQGLMERAAK